MYDGKYRRIAEMSFNHVTNPVKINFLSPGGTCNTRELSIAFIYGFVHITRVFFFPPEALHSVRL
jgi:hypothetical protein